MWNEVALIQINLFQRLPDEILSFIFSFFPKMQEVFQFTKVCKRFYTRLKKDQIIWKNLCLNWWKDKGLHKKYRLEWVYEKSQLVERTDWLFFARCFLKGGEHRMGSFAWPYIGRLVEGNKEGWGISLTDGTRIEIGYFHKNLLHGRGCRCWTDGNQFVGAFHFGDFLTGQATITALGRDLRISEEKEFITLRTNYINKNENQQVKKTPIPVRTLKYR